MWNWPLWSSWDCENITTSVYCHKQLFALSLPHHWMHLACFQRWFTTLLEEMEHYVFCGHLSPQRTGFTMAVYTQHCLLCHSVTVCCVCVLRAGSQHTAHPKPTRPSPPPAKPPQRPSILPKSWCSHNSGPNEGRSHHQLLSAALRQRCTSSALCQQTDGAVLEGGGVWWRGGGGGGMQKCEWQIRGVFICRASQVCRLSHRVRGRWEKGGEEIKRGR